MVPMLKLLGRTMALPAKAGSRIVSENRATIVNFSK